MMAVLPILLASVADPGDPTAFSRALGGLMFVIGGLAGLRHARKLHLGSSVLEHTPVIRTAQVITSAQAGLVCIRGTIDCDRPLLSPLTQTPCCFYRVEVEEPCDDGSATGMGWRPLHRETSTAGFKLRDATGVMEILPKGIEIDAPPTFQHEVISGAGNPDEERMLAYVRQNCPDKANRFLLSLLKQAVLSPVQEMDPRVQERLQQLEERHHRPLHRETRGHSFLFRETCFLPGSELEIAGTAFLNGSSPVIAKGPGKTPFFLSTHFGQELLPGEQNNKARNFAIVSAMILVAGVLMMISSWYIAI
jgi:hypothetical protein